MIRATTPTFVLTLDDESLDLASAAHVYATFSAGRRKVTKADGDLEIEGNVVSVFLSQAETLTFGEGEIEIQLNWVYADGARAASEPATVRVGRNLLPEVLP